MRWARLTSYASRSDRLVSAVGWSAVGAILNAPVDDYTEGGRRLAYRLDDQHDFVLWPSRFAGLDDEEAGQLLATELDNLAHELSTSRRRMIRRLALLDEITTPLPSI